MRSTRNSITIGIVTLLLGGMVSLGNAQDYSTERELCLDDCRRWISEYGGFGGRSRGIGDAQARLYARCVERCERKFWKEFDEEFREQ